MLEDKHGKRNVGTVGQCVGGSQQKIGAVAEEVSEQAYNELVAIRREKLRGLQEAGNDPFELTSYPQADFAAEVKESFVDVPEGEQGAACAWRAA